MHLPFKKFITFLWKLVAQSAQNEIKSLWKGRVESNGNCELINNWVSELKKELSDEYEKNGVTVSSR